MRVWLLILWLAAGVAKAKEPPNIVWILADDLGYGEVGCYGQTNIQTPQLDRMAREGLRFTRFYAGSTVCAPSRAVLMTGKHTGHVSVRGNGSAEAQRLRAGDQTVAEVLKARGYATGLIGKWGLGLAGDEGHPNRQGFDYFHGYLSQVHAHNHYPDYLWRNEEKVALANGVVPVGNAGGGYATNAVEYAGDVLTREALGFLERHRGGPFFLYLSYVAPHANNERTRALGNGSETPTLAPYEERLWAEPLKRHAAMVTRLDAQVGAVLERLRALGMAEKTLVIFSSDNGPHREAGHDAAFFRPGGELRGYKRDFFEGGIRVPTIAWWPGRIRAGRESDHVAYFGDFMATARELAGLPREAGSDGLSFLPTLLERGRQRRHEYLYWEFHEGGFSQAVLMEGRWKGIRTKRRDAPIQIYDLQKDPGEQTDRAEAQPRRMRLVEKLFSSARTNDPLWPVQEAARR